MSQYGSESLSSSPKSHTSNSSKGHPVNHSQHADTRLASSIALLDLLQQPIYQLPVEILLTILGRISIVDYPALVPATWHLLRKRGLASNYSTDELRYILLWPRMGFFDSYAHARGWTAEEAHARLERHEQAEGRNTANNHDRHQEDAIDLESRAFQSHESPFDSVSEAPRIQGEAEVITYLGHEEKQALDPDRPAIAYTEESSHPTISGGFHRLQSLQTPLPPQPPQHTPHSNGVSDLESSMMPNSSGNNKSNLPKVEDLLRVSKLDPMQRPPTPSEPSIPTSLRQSLLPRLAPFRSQFWRTFSPLHYRLRGGFEKLPSEVTYMILDRLEVGDKIRVVLAAWRFGDRDLEIMTGERV